MKYSEVVNALFFCTSLTEMMVIEQALRCKVNMFPEIALRELLANALIHQDFGETGASVMVELYDDQIEISNPGKPFIPADRFIDEYRSRNERLADIMRRPGICEEKGSITPPPLAKSPDCLMPFARSGCGALQIGIESLTDGSFIYGLDEDTLKFPAQLEAFIEETGVDVPSINLLRPIPGTGVFNRLAEEVHLLHSSDDHDAFKFSWGQEMLYKPLRIPGCH